MDNQQLKNILEALLMSSGQPLSLAQLSSAFDDLEQPEPEHIEDLLAELAIEYSNRGIELVKLASGYCLQTKAQYGQWVSRLQAEKPAKYSKALLETLAIIAYKQPVTRADIEDIRGVTANPAILKTLLEREWIKIAGHRDVPGKPAVYMTTKPFLDYFNLENLHQLPAIANQSECPSPVGEAFINECIES